MRGSGDAVRNRGRHEIGQGDADHHDARPGLVDHLHLRLQGLDQRGVEIVGECLEIARVDRLRLAFALGRRQRDDDARDQHLVEACGVETRIAPAFDAAGLRIGFQPGVIAEKAAGAVRRAGSLAVTPVPLPSAAS